MKSSSVKKMLVSLIFIAPILIWMVANMQKSASLKEELSLIKNGELAIGTVVGASKTGWYSRANVSFSFYCDTLKIASPLSKYPRRVQRDERYLVAYLPGNQKKAIMLFDYPIKDSTDFRRYVKEFEQKRKKKE